MKGSPGPATAAFLRRAGTVSTIGLVIALSAAASTASANERQDELPPTGDDVLEMHLERGLFYMDQGEFARALIEFEQVMELEFQSADTRERAEVYAKAARRFQRREQLTFSSFAQTGFGYYRENTTDSTRVTGDPARDPFVLARINTGATYLTDGDLSMNGSLDYRFRYYNGDRRNDSDLRWNGAVSRSLPKGSMAGGLRGRWSYRGESTFRNDVAVFVNRDYLLDSDNSLMVEFDLNRREYQSRLSERDRTNATFSTTWTRAEQDGRGSLSAEIRVGYEWRRSNSPDGDATIYGAQVDWSKDIANATSIFLYGWYEHNGFHDDSVLFDEADAPVGAKTRSDDLYEFGGGLIHRFAEGWTLRPEVVYIRDESNALWGNYSSTDIWLAVRRVF